MIKTTRMLLDELSDYASPKTKLSRMVQAGECIQVVKGIYETDRTVPPYLLAGSIYGPSYISFEFALSYYGLIPEKVYAVTSASFEKKKRKKYVTPMGVFTYRDIPSDAFPYHIRVMREGDYWYRIAEPEKALCDMLYTLKPVRNAREMHEMLFEDLRIDAKEYQKLNVDIIIELSEKYHSTTIKKLASMLRRYQDEYGN